MWLPTIERCERLKGQGEVIVDFLWNFNLELGKNIQLEFMTDILYKVQACEEKFGQ